MSKIVVFYYLIHVLMSMALIGQSSALLKFLCLRPPFVTITPITANKSYFVTDYLGRYWNFIEEDTHYENYLQMRGAKNGYIGGILTKNNMSIEIQMKDEPFPRFDVTFRINFDGKGVLSQEQLFGIRLLKKTNRTVYTYYQTEWSDIKTFNSSIKDRMLKQIINSLDTTKPIKAVLNFKSNGFLFIQDQKMFYVYCCGQGNDWKLYDKEVETNLIVFEKSYEIKLGQIFGGYVNERKEELYLFGGQITSIGSFVRKYVHKCDYKIPKSGTHPRKIRLFCEKLFFRDVCDKSESNFDLETKIVVYLLIGAGIFLAVLVIVLVVMVVLKPKKKKIASVSPPTDTSDSSKKSPKKLLAQNRERVIGDKPKPDTPKGRGLSRKRTQDFRKK